jgi:hypothetical protein
MTSTFLTAAAKKLNSLIRMDIGGQLDSLEKRVGSQKNSFSSKKIRILMGPSFVMWAPSSILDRTLAMAFRKKGAEVIPIYCDSVQDVECNFIGGKWGNFAKSCDDCKNRSEDMWKNSPIPPIPFSKFIAHNDIELIKLELLDLTFDELLCFEKSGIQYGRLAKDILVNNYLVATPNLIDGHKLLIKSHLQNLMLVSMIYERILDEQRPDRVVSNDSYYGMWALMEHHCKSRGIPFYSHWPVTQDRVAFASNDAAMNLDFRTCWDNFSKIELTQKNIERVNDWLDGKRGMLFGSTKLAGHEVFDEALERIDGHKPTIILAANAIWDLAALNKQLIFKDMIDWVYETIEWFRSRPEYQLIIRPHPIETLPQLPKTVETVEGAIVMRGKRLPENVYILKSNAKITFAELSEKYNIYGLSVHSSTVGYEYPAKGFPVITTAQSPYRGFGFTNDPTTKEEYFSGLEKLLLGEKKEVSVSIQLLAKKFIKFYQFHYYAKILIFEGNPPKLANNYLDLLASNESPWGDVVNSIIDGAPINSSAHWLPES